MKSEKTVEQLRCYKEYGESILEILDLVSQNPPPQEGWVPSQLYPQIELLKKFAQKTVEKTSSPVKIGIMGEFSSGKTLLLSSLIGYAGAFPDSEAPSTGNVTAIRIIQQPELQTTKVGNFTVEYLSHEKAKECLQEMLKEAEKLVNNLSSEQLSTFKRLQSAKNIDTTEILKWCEQVWNQTQNLEMRYLLRELVIFVRTYRVYGVDICGKSCDIDHKTAKKGLELGSLPSNILELDFDKLPPVPKPWHSLKEPSVEDVQNSFSLIRRINVTVKVSKEIWDLSSLQGTNDFVLLDFPGLGAANSGVRDKILSLQAMEDVQTILLLLDGRKASTDTAVKIRSMLEEHKNSDLKDRILVGVGRFNQFPLNVKDEHKIDSLLENPLLSEETALKELTTLKDTIDSASNLTTKKENVVLLSQLYGLTKLADLSKLIQVCTPEFLPELNKSNKSEELERRQKWQQLSEMLPTSSILSKQLSDFVFDGGISRLRSLLRDHVAQHGMRQLLDDTEKKAVAPLEQEQNKLKNLLEEIPNYIPMLENPAYIILREAIKSLLITYRQFQEDLETKPVLENRNCVAVSDVIKDELIYEIFFNWNEWSLLFNRTKQGIITIQKNERFFFGDDDDEDGNFPTQSDDFYSVFVDTINKIQGYAHDLTIEAVTDLFSNLSKSVEKERNNLDIILLPGIEQDIQQKFSKRQVRLFNNILRSLDPTNQWQNLIIEHSGLTGNALPIDVDSLFPLARKDNNHLIAGQIFDWSPNKKFSVLPRPFNHQIAVLGLRDEITATASLHLVQYVSGLTKQVKSPFFKALKEILDSLQELLTPKHEPLLRYIASAEERSPTKTPPWLETLSQISAIPCPDKF